MKILLTAAVLLAGVATAAPHTDAARRIEVRFLAPCCWSESVAFHNSPAAQEMRAEIEKLVADGKTEAEIVDHYVGRYGERILREPRGNKWIWLTVGPIVAAFAGLGLLLAYLRRLRRTAASAPVALAGHPVRDDELEW